VHAVVERQVSLRWRDVDALGHVNHAVFLTYLKEGRDAFYVQALGRDPHYVVVRVEIDLRAEARYADRQLRVRIEVDRVGTTGLTTRGDGPHDGGRDRRRGKRVVTVLCLPIPRFVSILTITRQRTDRPVLVFLASRISTRLASYRASTAD